jgi:isoquinoline 1-oxidoreductase subunit alpha
VAGVGLLGKNDAPSREEVCRSMEGNICRCGTYARIVLAVRKAAETLKGGGQ